MRDASVKLDPVARTFEAIELDRATRHERCQERQRTHPDRN